MADLPQASPEEIEAVRLRWRAQHPEAVPGAGPTPEESSSLLEEIRSRSAAIEQESLRMLAQATRNAPSRSGANSKHMQLLWLVVVPIVALAALAVYVWQTISRAR